MVGRKEEKIRDIREDFGRWQTCDGVESYDKERVRAKRRVCERRSLISIQRVARRNEMRKKKEY